MGNRLLIFAAILALVGCNKNEEQTSEPEKEILHVRIEQNKETKTEMDMDNNILWSENDQVVAFMKTSYGYRYQLVPQFAGMTYADFERTGTSGNENLYAGIEWDHNVVYYPYSDNVKVKKSGANYSLDVVLPAEQHYAHESFGSGDFPMVAVSPDNDITFKNICGGMKLLLKGSQAVTSVSIEGKDGEKISGAAAVIAYTDGSRPLIMMAENASTTVTLDCGSGVQLDEDTATEFIITLPPLSFQKGFKATVSTSDNQTHVIETDKEQEIVRSTLLVMPEKTLEAMSPEPEQPSEAYYIKVDESLEDWSGDYLITYSTASAITVFDSFSGSDKGVSRTDLISHLTSEVIHSDHGDPYKAVVTKIGDKYSVYLTGVGYLGITASKNSISKTDSAPTSSTTDYLWTFSYKSSGSVWMNNVGHSGYRLQWNKSAACFRCYTGSQAELTLYRRSTSTGGNAPDGPGSEEPDQPVAPEPDPDPEQPGDIPTPVPGQSGKYGWYELPVINYSTSGSYLIDSNDSDLYYAHHMCAGNEKGPGGRQARNYTVCFSAEHHCPVWVAAPRHRMYESGASRTDAYAKDPSIPSDIQYSSKSTGGGCNKGHMLGSAERLSSTATNKQVFYYTNIAPQYSDTFNTGGGGWNTLEDWVDGQVCSDTLYVVIGAYFDTYTDPRGYTGSPKKISFGGRSDVSRPTMFYYLLMRTKSGSSGKALSECTASEIKCAAFVRSHETPKGTKVSSQEMMSVSDLEKITGFTYFPNVPQAPKDSFKASEWGL